MTEQNPEQPAEQPQLPPDPEPTEDAPEQLLHDAPKDAAAAVATGYAVYDRTVAQYVPGVESTKPTKAQAEKRVPEGHTAAVVRV